MVFFDHWIANPINELKSSWHRVPHREYSKLYSLQGRAVCLLKIFSHASSIIIKPIVYFISGVALSIISLIALLIIKKTGEEIRFNFLNLGVQLILTALVAPVGQIYQVFKATMGLLFPSCYFKEDKLNKHFAKLAQIAEEIKSDPEFVELLKNGSEIVYKKNLADYRKYYEDLIEHNLAIIGDKLSSSDLPKERKKALLDNLVPLSDNQEITGINACLPGLLKILDKMCYCLDIPHHPEQIIPWLEVLFKMDILDKVVLQPEVAIKFASFSSKIEKEGKALTDVQDQSRIHYQNFIVVNLGDKIGLPKEMMEKASHDLINSYRQLIEDDENELLKIYHKFYSKENYVDFLSLQINSQPDGGMGLKEFRNHIIQKLCENLTEEEIKSSISEVKKKFGLRDIFADEPIYYVKFHYFLHPDLDDPSDERSSDLNSEGIKAFLKIK